MKYLDEFRNGEVAKALLGEIQKETHGQWAIMEVCGGQTHSIIRNGIDQLLPRGVELMRAACDVLGLDPLQVANEGKLVAIVHAERADAILSRMKDHPFGIDAADIGGVTEDNPGLLAVKTPIGGTRVVSMQIGEQLSRIC